MPDHPLHELNDMKSEFHANPHTRMAIIICSALAVVIIVGFLLFAQILRAPGLPVDPVAQGAASAFDVGGSSPLAPVEMDTAPAAAQPAPPLNIKPADITPP